MTDVTNTDAQQKKGYQTPEILLVCDYYHHRPFLAFIGVPVGITKWYR